MVSYENNPDNFDEYGFPHRYKFNRSRMYRKEIRPSKKSNKYVVAKTLGITFLIFIVCSAFISGYYAWKEFPNDSVWIKLIRLWIAIVFSPFYIFYIFIKTTVYKDV